MSQTRHQGDNELALGIKRVDAFLFKPHANINCLDHPNGRQRIHSVPGESADGFSDDVLHFTRLRLFNHLLKSDTLPKGRATQALIRK
nr:hypothetical protein [Bacteroides acidifaciens]